MIFYFSGTGNSRLIAEDIAHHAKDKAFSVCSPNPMPHAKVGEQSLGLVFPVYGWGMPKPIRRFIRSLPTDSHFTYVYVVMTCGDDIGLTDKLVRQALRKRGITLNAVWSIQMPNTYVALPGFDVDTQELAMRKLAEASQKTAIIATHIIRHDTDIIDVVPGTIAWVKSHILGTLFHLFFTGDKGFRTTADCTGCGHCARVCPQKNIYLLSDNTRKKPIWKGNCADCLACYHACPHHAIRYGHFTKSKGQWQLAPTHTGTK